MKKALAKTACLAFAMASVAVHAAGPQTQILRFDAAPKPLLNPGKGWIAYGNSPEGYGDEALALVSVGYSRFEWSAIEPEEDVFDWSAVDKAIKAWAEKGKTFAFGVMTASKSSGSRFVTPKWVFDAGAAAGEGVDSKGSPICVPAKWDDKPFMDKLRGFVEAMAKRYDGSPSIEFIDIRSYGEWGEGHVYMMKGSERISEAGLRRQIQIHLDAFKRTRLMLPYGERLFDPVYEWAAGQGVGLRRDGVLGCADGKELLICEGKSPSAVEWFSNYKRHSATGGWKYSWGAKFSALLEEQTANARATYQNFGQWAPDAMLFFKERRPLIEKLQNKMGYHFLLTEAELPKTMEAGRPFECRFNWKNEGLSRIFVPCHLALGFFDSNGKPARREWLGPSALRTLAGGASTTETFKFQPGELKPGSYRLAIGLFTDEKSTEPDIRIGSDVKTTGAWAMLAQIEVR